MNQLAASALNTHLNPSQRYISLFHMCYILIQVWCAFVLRRVMCECPTKRKHPSIRFLYPLNPIQGGGAGAYPSCHWAWGRIHLGHGTSRKNKLLCVCALSVVHACLPCNVTYLPLLGGLWVRRVIKACWRAVICNYLNTWCFLRTAFDILCILT